METELVAVYRAGTLGEADIIAEWLDAQGIKAIIKNEYAVGVVYVPRVTAPKGIQVCVYGEEDGDRAKQLLQDHAEELSRKREQAAVGGPVEAVCEECGHVNVFPASAAGSVQGCAKCNAHVDVPGGEDFDSVS